MSDGLWMDVGGQSLDEARDQIGSFLSRCIDECSADVLTVDFRPAATQQDALKTMAARLSFPEYFGENLDALYDVVTERLSPECVDSPPQVWLFKCNAAQQEVLLPIKETLQEAMAEATDNRISMLWWEIPAFLE